MPHEDHTLAGRRDQYDCAPRKRAADLVSSLVEDAQADGIRRQRHRPDFSGAG